MSDHQVDEGAVAIVTGAGSGIGRTVSEALLGSGYRVVLAGRRPGPLAEVAAGWSNALAVPTDVRDDASVAALFAAARDTFGRVDVLVNNAGSFGPSGTVDEIDTADWADALEVNVGGTFRCAREAFAVMRAQHPRGGRIINNGSISAHSPRPGSAAYTTSKHAITGLTKSLSLDGRPHDIACGQIDIGNAATEMTGGIAEGARQADGRVLPEPTFDPRHVADAVRYMADLPLAANVQFLTITATAMPFLGRG